MTLKTLMVVAGATLLIGSGTANAQAATTPATATSGAHDTIQLTEFTVSESSLSGYIASESVTGTRVATQIKDLPFAISVITSEFMNDFDFFDLGADLTYTASLTGVDTQGNSILRGYRGTFTLRNGFYRLGLNDRINTDRIEIIKGANAAIDGATAPAGLINYVSKRPKERPSQMFRFTLGSNDMIRGETNVNGPLGSVKGIQFYQLFSAEA